MKRYIFSLLTIFTFAISASAQNQMHVFMKDGSSINLYVTEIDHVEWDSNSSDPEVNNPDDTTVTGEAFDITENSATIEGYANNVRDNEAGDLKIGIIYCTDGTPSKSNGTQLTVTKSQVAIDGKYTINLTGLGPNTTYYYRSYVYQSGLWFYGKVRSFTTPGLDFTTGTASSITCFCAKVTATVNAPVNVSISEYGICYGTDTAPINKLRVSTKEPDGTIAATLRALAGNTIYYYRPYAVVNGVVSYGQSSSFKTLEDNVVITGEMDSDGNVYSRLTIGGGAYSNLEIGLCWSKYHEFPSVNDKCTQTNELDDENNYVIKPEFRPGTNYYRSYVKIDGVAHYGAVKVYVGNPVSGGQAVDLGLSVKWADMNVGASSPEDYGEYFAWGETEPKSAYNWSTYFDSLNASNENFKKYYIDGKTSLDPEDDAAHVNWGGTWRMPSIDELKELRNNCEWYWTTRNDVNGFLVVGPNKNSIFLPAGGISYGRSFISLGYRCYYWANSINMSSSACANLLGFGQGITSWSDERYQGLCVRPVCQ